MYALIFASRIIIDINLLKDVNNQVRKWIISPASDVRGKWKQMEAVME